MAKMTDDQRMEKVVQKLLSAIAEFSALDHPLWPSQMTDLRKAVQHLEDRLKTDRGMFHEPTNR